MLVPCSASFSFPSPATAGAGAPQAGAAAGVPRQAGAGDGAGDGGPGARGALASKHLGVAGFFPMLLLGLAVQLSSCILIVSLGLPSTVPTAAVRAARCRPVAAPHHDHPSKPAPLFLPQHHSTQLHNAGRTADEGCGGAERRQAGRGLLPAPRCRPFHSASTPIRRRNPAGGAASLRQAGAAAAHHRPLHRSALVCLAAKQVEVAVRPWLSTNHTLHA